LRRGALRGQANPLAAELEDVTSGYPEGALVCDYCAVSLPFFGGLLQPFICIRRIKQPTGRVYIELTPEIGSPCETGRGSRRAILRALVCALAALGVATPACLGQQYSFSTIATGLGNLNVICIAQDRTGYLWVGTENGLYRFDGREFRAVRCGQ